MFDIDSLRAVYDDAKRARKDELEAEEKARRTDAFTADEGSMLTIGERVFSIKDGVWTALTGKHDIEAVDIDACLMSMLRSLVSSKAKLDGYDEYQREHR
jgi:hypothetical protein